MNFPTRAKNNQHKALEIPKGRVHYSETEVFGLRSANYMASFCSASELLIAEWHKSNAIVLTPGADRRTAFAWCERLEGKLEGMLNSVTSLGITPLSDWLSARLEQEDI